LCSPLWRYLVKRCSKCGRLQAKSEFWIDRRRGSLMPHCKTCKRAYQRLWRSRNPDHGKQRYWNNRDSERERHLKRKYGVDFATYDRMLSAQGGLCLICGRPEPEDRMLDVDHDHKTGIVRGLLCTSCNRMIGHAHDSPERLRAAADYLSSRSSRRSSFGRSCRPGRKGAVRR